MAFETPTDTTNPTPTPAPDAAPQQSAPAPEDQSVAGANQSTPQQPAQQQPATAPANSLPPSKSSGVHGVLSGIVMGALAGAAHVAGKVGHGLKAWDARTSMGQARAANKQELVDKQQDAQIKQQKAAQDATKSMDEHTLHQIEYNNATLQGHTLAVQAQKADEADTQAQVDLASQFANTLKEQGIDLDVEHGAGHGGLTTQDAQDAAAGKTVHLFNGQTGKDAGVSIMNTDALNQPLTHDVKMPLKMGINPTTGKLETTDYQTIKADGHNTIGTAFDNFQHVQKMGVQAQADFTQQQKNIEDAAKAKKAGEDKPDASPKTVEGTSIAVADAKSALAADPTNKTLKDALTKAQAENDQSMHDAGKIAAIKAAAAMPAAPITDANKSLTGEDFVKTLPLASQDIVRSMGHYQLDSKDLPRGKEKLPIMESVYHGYPSFSEAKYNERYQYLKEYGTTTTGDGATRGRLNTAVGHLDLLSKAGTALAQTNLPLLNQYANQLGVATGQSPALVYNAIAEKTAGEIAGAVKGGAGSATDPALAKAGEHLDSKMSPQQRQGVMQAQAQILRTMVGTMNGKFQSTMGQSPEDFGQPVLYGGNSETLQRMAGGGASGPTPVYSNGKLVGHTTDGKTMTPVATQ